MGVRVEVKECESIESALRRLKKKLWQDAKRWTKKRYGYYEKPSVLKRKKMKMAKLWRHSGNEARGKLHLHIGLRELFARNGPTNAAGQ